MLNPASKGLWYLKVRQACEPQGSFIDGSGPKIGFLAVIRCGGDSGNEETC